MTSVSAHRTPKHLGGTQTRALFMFSQHIWDLILFCSAMGRDVEPHSSRCAGTKLQSVRADTYLTSHEWSNAHSLFAGSEFGYFFLKTIPGTKEGGTANYVAGCAGLWQEGIDAVLSILPLKWQQEDDREIVLNVFIERERLMIEIRSSISCYMQPDKETIQSLSCGLKKERGMTWCVRTVWKGWVFSETVAWSAAWFWLFGCSAAASSREKGQLGREVGGEVPTDEGGLGAGNL